MNWKNGDIVKIERTGNNCNRDWVGFVSELTNTPYKGSPDNFTMLYGNHTRKEYSDMNFWDCDILTKATDEEIRIYTEVLPELKKRFNEVREVEVLGLRRDTYGEPIEIGDTVKVAPYLNVFNEEIYASHFDSHSYIKVWDKSKGILIPRRKYLLIQ